MPTGRPSRSLPGLFLGGCLLGASGFVASGTARAQPSGVDEPPGAGMSGTAPKPFTGLPLAAPPSEVVPGDNVQEAIPSPDPLPSAGILAPAQAPAPAPAPVSLDHPRVIDTATLAAADQTFPRHGIIGLPGEAARGLEGFLASSGNHLTCHAADGTDFVCLLPDGTDVAEVALLNGAARARDDAPASYREQEAAAQAARRGLWSDLPPPPGLVKHPAVKNTATLVAEGQTYVLDGLQGLGPPYAAQLQGYIATHGDALTCQPQAVPGNYICLLNDGTDIAKVALVNGAAVVSAEAPDAYRVQQREALDNRRGTWLHPPADLAVAATSPVPQAGCCAAVAGDNGADGIAYVGGVPTAVIAGETVFLVFAGAAGWGYYDHGHQWHGAPDGYRAHLEHFHPEGRGLRGNDHVAVGHAGGMVAGGVHPAAPGGMPVHGGPAPGGHPGGFVRPAVVSPAFHPGAAAPGFHPGPPPAGVASGVAPHAAPPVQAVRAAPAAHAVHTDKKPF